MLWQSWSWCELLVWWIREWDVVKTPSFDHCCPVEPFYSGPLALWVFIFSEQSLIELYNLPFLVTQAMRKNRCYPCLISARHHQTINHNSNEHHRGHDMKYCFSAWKEVQLLVNWLDSFSLNVPQKLAHSYQLSRFGYHRGPIQELQGFYIYIELYDDLFVFYSVTKFYYLIQFKSSLPTFSKFISKPVA